MTTRRISSKQNRNAMALAGRNPPARFNSRARALNALHLAMLNLGHDAEADLSEIMRAIQNELPQCTLEGDMSDDHAPLSSDRVRTWIELGRYLVAEGIAFPPMSDIALWAEDGQNGERVLTQVFVVGEQKYMLLVAAVAANDPGARWRPVTRGVLDATAPESFTFDAGSGPDSARSLSSDPRHPSLVTAIRALYALLGICSYKPRAVCRSKDDMIALDSETRTVGFVRQSSRQAVVGPLGAGGAPLAAPPPLPATRPGSTWRRAHVAATVGDRIVHRPSCLVGPPHRPDGPLISYAIPPHLVIG